jgi:NAD+ kinase
MGSFKRIGLIGRLDSEAVAYSLARLVAFLATQPVDQVYLDAETGAVLADHALPAGFSVMRVDRERLPSVCDLVIVVGGDGSLLGSARLIAGTGVPLLGVNRGRLGFLTDISPDAIEPKLGAILQGDYSAESRFLLQVSVLRGEDLIGESLALNDVVLHPGQFIRMIEFDLHIDGQFVYRQNSDGLIIATPTGSTAYALSGGGPIMHPALDALVLVPLNPHLLSSRPIVVSGDSAIALQIGEPQTLQPQVTCDGQVHIDAKAGDWVRVAKSPHAITLIHPSGHHFYDVCRNKLGWATRYVPSQA